MQPEYRESRRQRLIRRVASLYTVTSMIDGQRAGQDLHIIEDGDTIIITDLEGAALAERARPARNH